MTSTTDTDAQDNEVLARRATSSRNLASEDDPLPPGSRCFIRFREFFRHEEQSIMQQSHADAIALEAINKKRKRRLDELEEVQASVEESVQQVHVYYKKKMKVDEEKHAEEIETLKKDRDEELMKMKTAVEALGTSVKQEKAALKTFVEEQLQHNKDVLTSTFSACDTERLQAQAQCAELTTKVEKLNAAVRKGEGDLRVSRSAFERLETDSREAQSVLRRDHRAQQKKSQEEITELKGTLAKAQTEVSDGSQKCQKLEHKLKKTRDQLSNSELQVDVLSIEVEKEKSDRKEVEKKLVVAEKAAKKSEELRAKESKSQQREISEMSAQLHSNLEEYSSVIEKLEVEKVTSRIAVEKNVALDKRSKELEQKLAEATQKLTSITDDHTKLLAANQSLTLKSTNLQTQLQTERATNNKSLQNLAADFKKVTAERDGLLAKNSDLVANHKTIEDNLSERIEWLERKLNETMAEKSVANEQLAFYTHFTNLLREPLKILDMGPPDIKSASLTSSATALRTSSGTSVATTPPGTVKAPKLEVAAAGDNDHDTK